MARALTSWKDDSKGRHSAASLGPCFIMVFWSDMAVIDDKVTFAYSVVISTGSSEAEKTQFKIPDFDEHKRHVSLDEAKAVALERARELGCKLVRRKRERCEEEEEWLAELQTATLEQIEMGQRGYEEETRLQRHYGSHPGHEPYRRLVTTSYFPVYFEQHYLGSRRTRRELASAVNIVLGRLERAGKIESMTLGGQRYWSPKSPAAARSTRTEQKMTWMDLVARADRLAARHPWLRHSLREVHGSKYNDIVIMGSSRAPSFDELLRAVEKAEAEER